jgi:hypothetical protein
MENNIDTSSNDNSMKGRADTDILLRTAGLFAMLEVDLMVDEDNNNNSNKRKGLKKRQFTSIRRSFDHHGAHNNIQQDHLGGDALFGKEFPLFFRLSRPRVELVLQRIGNSDDPFYQSFRTNQYGLVGPLLEAKILLPIKVLAYGVAPHAFAFSDYFQMLVSQSGKCCQIFNRTIPLLFGEEYSQSPTASDL